MASRHFLALILCAAVGLGYVASGPLPTTWAADDEGAGRMAWTALLNAIRAGDLYEANGLLSAEIPLEDRDDSGKTPLLLAAELGHAHIVESLLKAGADLYAVDKGGQTALHLAVAARQLYMADNLLYKGIWINATDDRNYTPINVAAVNNDAEAISRLALWGPDTMHSVTNERFSTAIALASEVQAWDATARLRSVGYTTTVHHVAGYGDIAGMRDYLAVSESLLENESSSKMTPVMSAVAANQYEMTEYLIERGANITARGYGDVSTGYYAVYNDNPEMLALLMEHGVDVNFVPNRPGGRNYLHLAVALNKPTMLRFMVENGGDLLGKDFQGNTVLHWAVDQDFPEITRYLIDEAGAPLESVNNAQQTPLHLAAQQGKLEQLRLLISRGADVGATDRERMTPLHFAVQEEHVEVLRELLGSGADADLRDRNGNAPLHLAINHERPQFLRILLNHGADVEAQDRDRQTPLHVAINQRKNDMVPFLLEAGAAPDALDKDGETPLHKAIRSRMTALAKQLAEKGADVNVLDRQNRNLLFVAAENESTDLAAWLLESGLDIHHLDRDENTPLHAAAARGSTTTLDFLIDQGANIEAKNKDEQTPLHVGAQRGHILIVRNLVDRGADIWAQDKNGQLPLHLSTAAGHWGPAQMFILRGLSIDTTDTAGNTPLHTAASNGHLRACMLLIAKGANLVARNEAGQTALDLIEAAGARRSFSSGLTPQQITQQRSLDRTLAYFRGVVVHEFHDAARFGDEARMAALCETFPDFVDVLYFGVTPLIRALSSESYGCAALLLKHGARPNLPEETVAGDRPVHAAVRTGNKELLRLVLEHGGNPAAGNATGQSALALAREMTLDEVIHFLENAE